MSGSNGQTRSLKGLLHYEFMMKRMFSEGSHGRLQENKGPSNIDAQREIVFHPHRRLIDIMWLSNQSCEHISFMFIEIKLCSFHERYCIEVHKSMQGLSQL